MTERKTAGGVIMPDMPEPESEQQLVANNPNAEMPKVGPQGQSCRTCDCCATAKGSPIGLCRAGRPHMTIYFRPPTIAGGPPVPDSMAGWPVVHLDENWCVHDFVAKVQH